MENDNFFKKLIIITITLLLVVISFLIYLSNNIETRVVSFTLKGGKENASIRQQRVELKFNIPISRSESNIKLSISAENDDRELRTKNFILGERLVIAFDSNLNYSSKYKIEISGLKDIYKNELNDFVMEFSTVSPGFYYLDLESSKSRLMKRGFKNNENILVYEKEGIKLYAFNSRYLAVVSEKEETSQIEVIEISSGTKVKELSFDNKQLGEIEMIQNGNKIIFTLQEYKYDGDFIIPTSGFEIYYYDIELAEQHKFTYGDFDFDVSDLILSPDGNFVLVEDSSEGFYLIDLNDNTAGISLGKFISTGGFNANTDKIVFLSFEPSDIEKDIFITYYDLKTGLKNLTQGDYEVIDPKFFNNTDNLVYAKLKDTIDSRGIYKIVQSTIEGKESDLLDSDGFSLEYPVLSYDDRFLIVEKYMLDHLSDYNYSRSSGYLTKPNKANLVIFDMKEKKIIIDNIKGIEAKWDW